MSTTPVNPSTEKVRQTRFPLSLAPSSPTTFPISYADNIWDVVTEGQTLAALLGQPGQYDQHTINEQLAQYIYNVSELLWGLINGGNPPDTHSDFTDDFTDDFD